MSDTLTITCHFCGRELRHQRVEAGKYLAPSTVIRWHEAIIAHVRREHQARRAS